MIDPQLEAPDGFEQACSALHEAAYRAAYRICGSREAAQDCAQEALARALVRWRRVADYALPWVIRVASNLALDDVRRRARLATTRAEAAYEDRASAERVDLARALRRLSARQREIVLLRHLADYSESEVARMLEISPSAVGTHAQRALKKMRGLLDISDEEH